MDNSISKLFKKHFGHTPEKIEKLKGAGSNRIYSRLTYGTNIAIGVEGESQEEDKGFVILAQHFKKNNLNVPEVYEYAPDYSTYIQEDLGNISLFDAVGEGIKSGDFSSDEKELILKTIRLLPHFQFKAAKGINWKVCYPQKEFDKNTVMWDLNYFKYCFLKTTGTDFLEPRLEEDFRLMANDLANEKLKTDTFLYRDFQARNVMIKDGKPYFIDFQGGRKGPVYYDVASFVWQAKANYPADFKTELVNAYFDELQQYVTIDRQVFDLQLKQFVFFRTLQVLGAYGFRGYFEHKAHFLQSIPFAIANLKSIIDEQRKNYPYLCSVLDKMCTQPQFAPKEPDVYNYLTVNICSFSYRKGIPMDSSGNGGGYVFDCRGMHNPGRYDQYKQLTGLDQPVKDFLVEQGEIQKFLQSVFNLADAHIAKYLKREFTHLSFCFGCTGGQHRSVYSAQHLAEYIADKYPQVRVKLQHREQHIKQQFNF